MKNPVGSKMTSATEKILGNNYYQFFEELQLCQTTFSNGMNSLITILKKLWVQIGTYYRGKSFFNENVCLFFSKSPNSDQTRNRSLTSKFHVVSESYKV